MFAAPKSKMGVRHGCSQKTLILAGAAITGQAYSIRQKARAGLQVNGESSSRVSGGHTGAFQRQEFKGNHREEKPCDPPPRRVRERGGATNDLKGHSEGLIP